MRLRQGLLILLAALVAACLGLAASVAVNGPGPLLRSELGQQLLDHWPGRAGSAGPVSGPGDHIPPFRLPDLVGSTQAVPTPGKLVLINYWASWCAPCREELPLLAEFAGDAGDGIEVLGIALDTPADAAAFLITRPLPFQILVEAPGPGDSSMRLGNRHGVLPFSVLIGADGRLLKRRFGPFASVDDIRGWTKATP